jgi:hypothetical protein
MVEDWWRSQAAEAGVDDYCLNCGHRVPRLVRQPYDALRACVEKGYPEEDEFVLTRDDVLFIRTMGI